MKAIMCKTFGFFQKREVTSLTRAKGHGRYAAIYKISFLDPIYGRASLHLRSAYSEMCDATDRHSFGLPFVCLADFVDETQ